MKRKQALQIRDLMPIPSAYWPPDMPFTVRIETRWVGEDCVAVKMWVDGEVEPDKWTHIDV